ncbi:SEC12-like protein 2 [Apostasia shenzhenica]|uniref:SEC12-like protein 2 n=1 Tax=Apostasia shenzhenica TaxID=1088818 RepID=A0A2I0AVC8_9ASPA|nr:SEC12-like protein 2 [Apostasia shenzhenica]
MAKGGREMPPCSKTYGFPLYVAAWVPIDRILEKEVEKEAAGINEARGDGEAEAVLLSAKEDQLVLVLGGGGGEGRSGVPNAVLLSLFDVASRSLSDQPLHRLGTEGEIPYRMAMHPGGHGFICSFPKSCRWFQWDVPDSKEPHKLALKSPKKPLHQLEDIGPQLALAFDSEGTLLAAGGEDGHLRVFKWPSMEVILNEKDAHTSVKDLNFSFEGKFLVSLGDSGPCRIWDLSSSTALTSLPLEEGERFGHCRFLPRSDILYVTAMHGVDGKIISWSTSSWKRISSKKILRDTISAFSVSNDGKFLATGTVEGDVAIINSSDLMVQMTVRRAHLGPVTALEFSQDSRLLKSNSSL